MSILFSMDNTTTTKTVTSQNLGDTTVHKEQISTAVAPQPEVQKEYTVFKTTQIVWFFFHIVGIILALRFLFLLLGANRTGIVFFLYTISQIFVAPFEGIFPEAASNQSYFDTATIVAILMWYLLAVLVTKTIRLFSDRRTATGSTTVVQP